jgi:hypothetical protein
VVWIVYVATTSDAVARIAFAILLVVALIGFTMLANVPAEQHFPDVVVGVHGVLAATTLVLVLLSAAGVGS